MALVLGCMSGTSLDGVDAVLAEVDDRGASTTVRAHAYEPFDDPLREDLLALNTSGADELHRASLAANEIARRYAAVCTRVLAQAGVPARQVLAIGAHGQTVRHRPQEFDGTGYTAQLLNGALLAELTGIDVVCDLRSRDVAAGGQGAPLVPAFHAGLFGSAHEDVAVLNLGGIGNLTLLPRSGPVLGYDCGPGNVLLDLWCARHTGQRFDEQGRWGAAGRCREGLLQALLADPFFERLPPKSTGRDLFDARWLDRVLAAAGAGLPAQDVQATLAEFTAQAATRALRRDAPGTQRLLVCGGGALNAELLSRLQAALPRAVVEPTSARGVPVDQVEAMAFAWLAAAFCAGRPGNLPAVTGARGLRVLGALHRAGAMPGG